MKRTGNSGKRGKTVLALFLCLIFFAGGAGALEIQPGELSLSARKADNPPAGSLKCGFVLRPMGLRF